MENRRAQLDVRPAAEGQLAGRHLVEQHAERPDVCPLVHRFVPKLLRRHARHRSHHVSRQRQRNVQLRARDRGQGVGLLGGRPFVGASRNPLGQAEVEHLDLVERRDHHVRSLEVAVEDPTLVRVREGGSDLDAEVQHGFRGQPVPRQQRVERLAFDGLHGDVGLAIGLAHLEHGADVRMVQGGGGTRLVQQAERATGSCMRCGGSTLSATSRCSFSSRAR